MRKMLLVSTGLLLLLPVLALAQAPRDCPTCLLGLFDDTALNKNCGTITAFTAKDIYLGAILTGTETGLTGLEFSLANMRQTEDGILVTAVEGITEFPPNIFLGSVQAPADTSATSAGTGGANVNWPACVQGTKLPLLKISILTFNALTDKQFTVMHKFAPSNPAYGLGGPIIIACDAPTYTPIRVTGGYYIANPSANPPAVCFITVNSETWGAVKQMYR